MEKPTERDGMAHVDLQVVVSSSRYRLSGSHASRSKTGPQQEFIFIKCHVVCRTTRRPEQRLGGRARGKNFSSLGVPYRPPRADKDSGISREQVMVKRESKPGFPGSKPHNLSFPVRGNRGIAISRKVGVITPWFLQTTC